MYNALNVKIFLTITMPYVICRKNHPKACLCFKYLRFDTVLKQDFLLHDNKIQKKILIVNISCIITYIVIGNRKIIRTPDSLGHRFWLAAPKIWAQIRPCEDVSKKSDMEIRTRYEDNDDGHM